MIRIGPAGIGGFNKIPKFLENYNKEGISAGEIPFTYQIWISNSQAKEIKLLAEKFNVKLSIHSPYYINLNSSEKEKIEESKKRILNCCERAHYLGAEYVIFHAGYYGKNKDEAYEIIKKNILDMQDIIKKNRWDVKLTPEMMGKVNVFGTSDEILNLVRETKCHFCIDFAHLFARSNGTMSYNEMCKSLKEFKHIHAHFSGIEFGLKGEKNHKKTSEKEIEKLGEAIKDNHIKDITIINESPDPINDSIKTIDIFKKLKLI